MKIDTIEMFLRAEVDMIKKCVRTPIGGYVSISHFVLENGIRMQPPDPKLPRDIKRGKLGLCYENAGKIALNVDTHCHAQTDYVYCEGYAWGVFPVLHGWLLTPDGKVIDPTWQGRKNFETTDYYGIAFQTEYLRDTIIQNEHWALIDLPLEGFPLFHTDQNEWRHPIMDRIKNHKNNC